MKKNEVKRGSIVLHDRRNQGRLKHINKLGIILSDELMADRGSIRPDLVRVLFLVPSIKIEPIHLNKLRLLSIQDSQSLIKDQAISELLDFIA